MFDNLLDPNLQWEIMLDAILNILSIMCPFKKVFARKTVTPWLSQEIYSAIREKKILVKKYRQTRNQDDLRKMKITRNNLNTMIERTKRNFIKNSLKRNTKNPKKFWRIINNMIKNETTMSIFDIEFRNLETNIPVSKDDVPDFLNAYFAQIATRTRPFDFNTIHNNDYVKNVDNVFEFEPPNLFEIKEFVKHIDTTMSSCIAGVNARMCKTIMEIIPGKFLKLFANSLFTGIFPEKWTYATLTFLPKDGDKSNPGNWRPISQTNIFSKILEKIVHTSLLKYLLTNNLIVKQQFGFVPGKSTHQAVFKVLKHMYGSLNNNKVIGTVFLDVAKAFNCIDQDLLFLKMIRAGFSANVLRWFQSYLIRYQIVNIQERHSVPTLVPAVVAQGTVLGPLLFIFYINDILSCLDHVNISMFADDCVLYLSGNNWEIIRTKLQND